MVERGTEYLMELNGDKERGRWNNDGPQISDKELSIEGVTH